MRHLPILRQGVLCKSLDVVRAPPFRTREPVVEISHANAGWIRRDLRPKRLASAREQTNQMAWDQPHEGNLFEHLDARRSFQQHADAALAAAGGA
jgi:hypothetical protein